jgi:hypothetical protein
MSGYPEELRALTKGLAAETNQALTICYSSRLGEE